MRGGVIPGERHAHAPATREVLRGAVLHLGSEAQTLLDDMHCVCERKGGCVAVLS